MDMRRSAALIRCPTLVIAGQFDVVTLPKHSELIVSTVSGSKLIVSHQYTYRTSSAPGRHAPGTSVIECPAIYRGLRREGYRGWMAMEFLPTGDAAAELRKAAAETVVPAKRILK
jgi:hypothetical protein